MDTEYQTAEATGVDAPAQLSVLSYLKSPRAQLQPALLLAPKFPRDSALARHCSLDCPEIPQGCSSKTTTAFSHSHGGIFYFDFFFFICKSCWYLLT